MAFCKNTQSRHCRNTNRPQRPASCLAAVRGVRPICRRRTYVPKNSQKLSDCACLSLLAVRLASCSGLRLRKGHRKPRRKPKCHEKPRIALPFPRTQQQKRTARHWPLKPGTSSAARACEAFTSRSWAKSAASVKYSARGGIEAFAGEQNDRKEKKRREC